MRTAHRLNINEILGGGCMRHISSAHALSTSFFCLLGTDIVCDGVVTFVSLNTAERSVLPANLQQQRKTTVTAVVTPIPQGRPANQRLAESQGPGERNSADSSAAPQTSGNIMAENPGASVHTISSPSDANHHPSALRNRGPITAELSRWLQRGAGRGDDGQHGGSVLEIASGTGCHVEAFAKALPNWTFKPTEYDQARVPDITATIAAGGNTNILPPERLDVCSDPSVWPRPPGDGQLWDAVMCSNMIHIAPPECTPNLLSGAAAGLRMGGRLFLYGPFALSGLLAPESNVNFDKSLKLRSDGVWGIKDVVWVAELADARGLELTDMAAMPANNFFVTFTKVREAGARGDSDSAPAGSAAVTNRISAVVAAAKAALLEKLSSK